MDASWNRLGKFTYNIINLFYTSINPILTGKLRSWQKGQNVTKLDEQKRLFIIDTLSTYHIAQSIAAPHGSVPTQVRKEEFAT